MANRRRAVVSADIAQLQAVEQLVARGRYPNISAFVREAMHEKLQRLRLEELTLQVKEYCEAGHADEELDLMGAQSLAGDRRASYQRKKKKKVPREEG